MCDIYRVLRDAELLQRVLDDARQSPDPARRAMARSASALSHRSYELERQDRLSTRERLEAAAASEQFWMAIRWLADHKEPIQ